MLELLKQIDLEIALLALAITYWAWRNGRMTKELLKEWRSEDQKREERWQEEQRKYQEEQKKRDEEWRKFFDNFDKRHAEYQKIIMEALTKISENLAHR